MNVHHLKLFYYIAKYEGITRAVRRMPYGIQQPAVSSQILQLEADLGVTLFQRRPFVLTSAGRELYAFARPFFSQLDDLADRLRGEGKTHLRVAAAPTFLTNHLPSVLEALKLRVPDLRLSLREVTPVEAEDLVNNQEVDGALLFHREVPEPPMKFVEFMSLPVVLLAPPGAKCRTLGTVLKTLSGGEVDTPLVTLPGHEVLTQLFRDTLRGQGVHWVSSMEVNTLELVHTYVGHGFGYGLSVGLPVADVPEGVSVIRLPKFPKLRVGFSYAGELNPVASETWEAE